MPRVTARDCGSRIPWSSRSSHHCDPVARSDVGAGEGRHAVWLASRGWRVTALDFSAVGVERGREHAQREGVSVDFVVGDVADWEPVSGAFDVLVSYLHLEEEAMERVRGWVAPGGPLVVVGHAAGGAAGPRNPRFRHTVASMRNRAGDLDVRRCEEVVDGAARAPPTSSWSLPVTTAT